MRAMFYRCVRLVEHALTAKREYMTKDGHIVDRGPDHYARPRQPNAIELSNIVRHSMKKATGPSQSPSFNELRHIQSSLLFCQLPACLIIVERPW